MNKEHVVYRGAKTNELEYLLNGKKMIIHAAAARKMTYGYVKTGDVFI